jgi:hypothetical protein
MSYQPVVRTTSTLAVVSLVFGIATWLVLPLVGAVVAIVCGHLARGEIRRTPPPGMDGDGLALAGLILGYVHLVVVVLLVLLFWGVLFLSLGAAWHWH